MHFFQQRVNKTFFLLIEKVVFDHSKKLATILCIIQISILCIRLNLITLDSCTPAKQRESHNFLRCNCLFSTRVFLQYLFQYIRFWKYRIISRYESYSPRISPIFTVLHIEFSSCDSPRIYDCDKMLIFLNSVMCMEDEIFFYRKKCIDPVFSGIETYFFFYFSLERATMRFSMLYFPSRKIKHTDKRSSSFLYDDDHIMECEKSIDSRTDWLKHKKECSLIALFSLLDKLS